MTSVSEGAALPPIVDDATAPIVYVDELVGGAAQHGNFTLAFATLQYDNAHNPPKPYRQVRLRLVVPPAGMQGLAQFINALLRANQARSPAGASAETKN